MSLLHMTALCREFTLRDTVSPTTTLSRSVFPDEETWDLYLKLIATVDAWRKGQRRPLLVSNAHTLGFNL